MFRIRIFKMRHAIWPHLGADLLILGLSDALHRVPIEILKIDPRYDTFCFAVIDLRHVNTIHHGRALMCEPDRTRQPVSAFLNFDDVSERRRIDPAETRALDRIIGQLRRRAATCQRHRYADYNA